MEEGTSTSGLRVGIQDNGGKQETPRRQTAGGGGKQRKRRGGRRKKLSYTDIAKQQEERRLERRQQLQEMIRNLTEVQARDLLQRVAERQTALVLDIWEEQPPAQGPPHEEQPLWCTCGKCRDMPTAQEEVCCRGSQDDCVTSLPEFHALVLDPMVLDLARTQRNDMLGMELNRDPNRGTRHTAYRQYVLWQHGQLGRQNRQVVPSCCVLRIRQQFPDPHGQYTGFIPSRLL